DSLEYDCWESNTASHPRALVATNAVVRLIHDNLYLAIRITSWTCCRLGGFSFGRGFEPTGCRADIDGDVDLTIFDFLWFQNLFDAGDLAADFDGDGSLTIFDFLAFQNEFDAGCG
ncbi:MAG: GC-type dockerin domain-anchored protein, partial [Phycisphaerales bacterium]